MIPSFRSFALRLACALSLISLAACQADQPRGPVVLAAISLQESLEEVADAWEAQGHARPVLSFAGTPAIARQIEAGAPADIVITADLQWMDWLAERGLVDAENWRLASNSLVWVGHVDDVDCMMGPCPAPSSNNLVAIADPKSVPAGRYAKLALEAEGIWEELEDRLIPVENVRSALVMVESGQVQSAIVYASDMLASQRVAGVGLNLPDGVEIAYPAARLSSAEHTDSSAFLQFLSQSEARAIFCSRGFTMPSERQAC